MTGAGTVNDTRRGRHGWLRMSLRTLLLLVTAIAVGVGIKANQARRQRQAAAVIQSLQGHIFFDYQWDMFAGGDIPARRPNADPPGPAWLRKLLGEEFFVGITGVTVTKAGDDLKFLNLLPKLLALSIEKSTVTDRGLTAIRDQTDLRYLWLDDTQISDAGLAHLQGMQKLQYLYLRNSQVTDEGVRNLKRHLPATRIY